MNKIPAAKPKGISNKVKANESQDEARMVAQNKRKVNIFDSEDPTTQNQE